jgi:hypothetical protein
MLKKTEISGIFKDSTSGGLINKDDNGLYAYKEKKRQMKKIQSMEKEIKEIKENLNTITSLLETLLHKE